MNKRKFSSGLTHRTEYTDLNKIIQWFIILRWLACLGVILVLSVVRFVFDYSLPYKTLYLLNTILLLVNLSFTIFFFVMKKQNLSEHEMGILLHLQIISDYALLFFLIYFTGYLENPFIFSFVYYIMLTSFMFSSTVVYIYVITLMVLLICVAILEQFGVVHHYSLSVVDDFSYLKFMLPRIVGLCTTLFFSAYLVTSIKKRLEEKGRRVEVELNRYKSLDKIKSNFMLQVTHELRGPIAAVSGYHEMIKKGITGPVNSKTNDVITKANRRTENLLNIIDEMIDYAYMTTESETRFVKGEVDVRDLIYRNVDIQSELAHAKDVDVSVDCSPGLTAWANRDPVNIILSNLITNAVRYSKDSTKVRIRAVMENGWIHITVTDEGVGIEPEELDKIFEEFYRSRKAMEIEKDGTGLGLPIVKRAVEALEGKISVYSEPDKGTSFHIHIPRYKPENKDGGSDGDT